VQRRLRAHGHSLLWQRLADQASSSSSANPWRPDEHLEAPGC
jgi:hypothetical protein